MLKLNSIMIEILKRIVAYIILVILWELLYKVNVDILKIWKSYNFPEPISVVKVLYGLMMDNTLLIAIVASFRRLLIGYGISLIFGILLGITIAKFKIIDKYYGPLVLALQTLPNICWLPFAILWFGLNEKSIIFIIIAGSTFALTIATYTGIKNVQPLYIKAARTMGARGLKLYWNVIFPAALPNIISGMKQGWSFSWRGLIAGEMFAATKGLGYTLMMGREFGDINQVAAMMLVIIFFGMVIDRFVFVKIEKNIRDRWGLSKA